MSGETSGEGTTGLAVEVEDIVGKDSFRDWLSGQTVDLARLLATRIALRTLPNVLIIHSTDASQVTKDNARKLTLHCFRASFLSWTAIEYPTHVMGPKAYSAAKSAADHDRLAVYEIIESATKSAANAANAADSASSAILCSANSAVFSARSAANSVTTYPARSVAQASIWEFIRTDASTVLMDGTSDVFASPLWPKTKNNVANQKTRVYVEKQITDFKQTEEYTALPWGLWIAWWESLQNDTSHSLFGEKADLEIALKDDEFWGRDVAVVMDELAEIVGWPWGEDRQEITEEPPQPGEDGYWPHLIVNNGALDAPPSLPSEPEQDDPYQQRLLDTLQSRFSDLVNRSNWLAQYPDLDRVLNDYNDLIHQSELKSLDIYSLWESGAALIEMARQFAAVDPNQQMTRPLEPEQAARLGELARLHGAFIMGFSAGRYWAERSGFPLLTIEEFKKLLENERRIVRWLIESDQFEMTERARQAFETLDKNLALVGINADQLATMGYPLLRSLCMFVGRALSAAVAVAGVASLAGIPVELAVTGFLAFVQDNATPLVGFAASQDEMRLYLEHHLRRLGIEYGEDEEEEQDDN